jgi:CubicO group peptidase (beta-lactamase class C family)
MHKFSLFISTCLLATTLTLSAWAAPPAGDWQGSIVIPGQELVIEVQLQQAGEQWSGTIQIPAQKFKGPLEKLKVEGNKVTFAIAGVPGNPTFEGTLDKNVLKGSFHQGGGSSPFTLTYKNEAAQAKTEADLQTKLKTLDTFIQAARQQTHTPGVAVAVIYKDKVVFQQGYGFADLEKQTLVTPQTPFAIGSSTKAFTATLMAQLAAEGQLEWDKPIQTWLPDFKLKDRFASERMTITDLLTHQSGLPRHDFAWYGDTTRSRADLFKGLASLDKSADFRTTFQYQNLMYMTAGYLAEQVTGKTWETLIQERLFTPLGMQASHFSTPRMEQDATAARPYRIHKDKPVRMPYRPIVAAGPAGSIYSNLEDMSAWVRFQLGDGKWGEQQLLEKEWLKRLHTPITLVSGSSPYRETPLSLYGPGWFVMPYRGHMLIQHGGNIDGFSAMVALVPEQEIGLVVLSNKNGDILPYLTMYQAVDQFLGLMPIDWQARLLKGEQDLSTAMTKAQKSEIARVAHTSPSHRLEDYVSQWSHPAYGQLGIVQAKGKLQFQLHGMHAELKHWHYDTFALDAPETPIDGIKVQFLTNEQGRIDQLKIGLEPSVAPIVFERLADPALRNKAYLQDFVGEYTILKESLTIRLEKDQLVAKLGEQPPFFLEPIQRDEFTLKLQNLKGFSLRFQREGGKVKRIWVVQPNGTFEAVRK